MYEQRKQGGYYFCTICINGDISNSLSMKGESVCLS